MSRMRTEVRMGKKFLLSMILLSSVSINASTSQQPRYIFDLPDGYVGWVQIIFNDPLSSPLPIDNDGVLIEVPESGVVRTSNLRVHSSLAPDEFYYEVPIRKGTWQKRRVPTDAVLPGIDHGGFSVMDTGGKGKGYSWFIFIGPPSIRAKTPLAEWNKEVDAWWRIHGNKRVSAPDRYPTPGRLPSTATP